MPRRPRRHHHQSQLHRAPEFRRGYGAALAGHPRIPPYAPWNIDSAELWKAGYDAAAAARRETTTREKPSPGKGAISELR